MATSPKQTIPFRLGVQDAKNQTAARSHAEVEKAAYNIWLAEGQQPGSDQKNWFEAELQLKGR